MRRWCEVRQCKTLPAASAAPCLLKSAVQGLGINTLGLKVFGSHTTIPQDGFGLTPFGGRSWVFIPPVHQAVSVTANQSGAQSRNYSSAGGFPYLPFLSGLVLMHEQSKERWMELCEQASKEQDPAKLMNLADEINRLLEQRDQKLKIRETPRGD